MSDVKSQQASLFGSGLAGRPILGLRSIRHLWKASDHVSLIYAVEEYLVAGGSEPYSAPYGGRVVASFSAEYLPKAYEEHYSHIAAQLPFRG